MIRKIIREAAYFAGMLSTDNINAFAAHSAYFFILSFIPLIILLMSLINFTGISGEYLIESVIRFFPEGTEPFITDIIGEIYHKSVTIVSVTAVLTLWSSGKGMAALKNGMYAAAHIEKKQSFLVFRILGALNTLVFILVITAALILGVFGDSIERMLIRSFSFTADSMWFVIQFRRVIMFVLYILIFTALYRIMPDWEHSSLLDGKKPKTSQLIIGAIVSALGWHLYSYAFSVYIRFSKGFENMYGSLGTLIGVMLWLYGCMYLLLAGLEVNVYIMECKKRKCNTK